MRGGGANEAATYPLPHKSLSKDKDMRRNNRNDNRDGLAEMAAFEAFSALDPIVRPLLAVVRRTHFPNRSAHFSDDERATEGGATRAPPSPDENPEVAISLLRTERTLLARLRTALLSIGGGAWAEHSAAALAEYVLLPPILVLQTSPADRRVSSDDDDNHARWLSVRSLENECAEGAALAVAAYVDGIVLATTREKAGAGGGAARDLGGGGDAEGEGGPTCAPPLSPKVVVRCVVACAMALPENGVSVPHGDATAAGGASGGASGGGGGSGGDLDRGEGRVVAILRCVRSLCDLCAVDAGAGGSSSSLAGAVAGEMRGALATRLVQSCLDAMMPPKTPASAASNAGGGINRRGVSVQLRLQSISTFRALLDGLPFPTLWRSLLPGCFSVLFRVAVSQLQSSRGSAKVAVESFGALSRLLVLTLSVDCGSSHDHVSSMDDAASERRGSGGSEAVLAQAAMLLRQAAAAGSPVDTGGRSSSSSRVQSTLTSKISTGPKGGCSSAPSPTLMKEVNSRLPAPLSLLINISSSHSSVAVKQAGMALCATILVDTRGVWEEGSRGLKRAALECCLVALNGEDGSSKSAVALFRGAFGPLLWRRELSEIVAPRILDLVEELPVLASSLREKEFKHRLDLISGYLRMSLFEDQSVDIDTEGDNRSSNMQRSAGNGIGASLCCESASDVLLRSLAGTLELDLNAAPIDPVKGSSSLVEQNHKFVGSSPMSASPRYRFLHIRKESSAASVKHMLHLLGAALGPQRCVQFVNSCISEVHDGCESATSKRALHGRGHTEWLRESTGLIVAANEVLVGVFGNKDYIEAKLANSSQDSSYKFPYSVPADTKFLHDTLYLLLPVMFRFPLWNLPTTLAEVENNSFGINKKRQSNDEALRQYFSQSNSRTRLRSEFCCTTEVSASALHGNTLIVSYLMTLVGTISEFLGPERQEFLHIVLYPILEKVDAHNNCQTVREFALATLARIAHATGKSTIAALLASNLDYLVEAIVSRLHVAGNGSQAVILPHSLPGVVEVILRSTFVEKSKSTNSSYLHVAESLPPGRNECLPPELHSALGLVEDVIEALLRSFDRVVTSANELPKSEMHYQVASMLRLFDATIGCLRASTAGQDVAVGDGDCRQRGQNSVRTKKRHVWMECLAFEFGKEAGNRSPTIDNEDSFAHLTPEEGFARYRMAKDKDSNDNCISAALDHKPEEESETSSEATDSVAGINCHPLPGEIQIANQMISRCVYFLSFDNFSIQVAACDVLRKGFDFIALTESVVLTNEKEDGMTTRNQLRPIIHKLWSPIHARLVATSAVLNSAEKGPSHLYFDPRRALSSPSEKDSNSAASTAFLDSLLTLISSLCTISGDFMRGRFESDVWPLLAKLLGNRVRRPPLGSEGYFLGDMLGAEKGYCAPPTMPIKANSSGTMNEPSLQQRSYFNSDERVVLAILSCISRVFASRECGQSLSHLVPSAGTIVLPFLSDEGAVGDAAVIALRSLLMVDCDCLWRGLLVMSGTVIAPNPVASRKKHIESQRAESLLFARPDLKSYREKRSGHAVMKKRALHLIHFVDGLDEQTVS